MCIFGKLASSPVDPITSKVFDKLPSPIRKISDPLDLKRGIETPEGRALLDPLNTEGRSGSKRRPLMIGN